MDPTGPAAAPTDTKRCPSCAETIRVEAVICRFCGFDFRTMSRPASPPVVVQTPRTNGLAVASLVLGIVWLYWIGSILALAFGYAAKGQIDRSEGRESGRGLAVAGIVLGWIGVGTLLLVIILGSAIRSTLTSYGR